MNELIPEAPPSFLGFLAPVPLPFPVLPILAALLACGYLLGVIRLRAQGRRWPVWRTISFIFGCLLLAAITGLGVEAYGYAVMSVFMFQQLSLMMVIPPLLVIGSPGTLLLRATPHRGAGRFVLRAAHAGLRSRVARWALLPWVALPLYLFAFYGLYIADLADGILAAPGGHLMLEISFLVTGILFAIPILSADPLPIRLTHGARALDVFAEAALHAFFGVFLMMASTLLVDNFAATTLALGIDPIEDQGIAGGIAWSYGEAPTLLMLMFVMHRWFRADTARDAADARYADAHGEPELDAYNAYLETLREKDARRMSSRTSAAVSAGERTATERAARSAGHRIGDRDATENAD